MLKYIATIIAGLAISAVTFAADAPKATIQTSTAVAAVADGNVFFTDKAGKHALDPLCGMQIIAEEKTAHSDYNGKRYYFCSDGCSKAFTAKPAENLEKLALPTHVVAISGNKMMVNCAVSAERVAVDDKTPHQVYKGHDYYFCCNKCPKSFAKNPDKYAIADASPAPAAK